MNDVRMKIRGRETGNETTGMEFGFGWRSWEGCEMDGEMGSNIKRVR